MPESRTPISFGKAETLRTGKDLTIVAVGSMVSPAWQAALALEAEGIDCSVINARWVKPIDFDTIFADAARTGRLLLVEENARVGGFGQMVRDEMLERGLSAKSDVMALPDKFIEHGAQPLIRGDLGLDEVGIAAKARALVKGTKATRGT